MDFRTIFAFALVLVIFFVFFQQPVQRPGAVSTNEVTTDIIQKKPIPVAEASNEQKKREDLLKQKDVRLVNEKVSLQLDATGAVKKITFFEYRVSTKSDELVEIDFGSNGFNSSALRTSLGIPNWQLEESNQKQIVLKADIKGVQITRRIELVPLTYILSVTDEIRNNDGQMIQTDLSVYLSEILPKDFESPGFFSRLFHPQAEIINSSIYQDGSLVQIAASSVGAPKKYEAPISWLGFSHKYFFFGLVPANVSIVSAEVYKATSGAIVENVGLSSKEISPGQTTNYSYQYYLGPMEISQLQKASPDLNHVVDFGNWIGPIARLLHSILNFFYGIFPNYGVAIILLTILVKACLFPLAYKAAVSARKMQRVQPKLKEIRERYKEDKHRQSAEMMALWKAEKVNPLGGCLPMLLQLPVFFALYRVFFSSIELRQAAFFGWIQDLSQHDPYFVTPALLTLLMWYQMKLTPTPQGMSDNETVRLQMAMMKWMPIVFGAMMLFLPSGLTLYFLVNAAISIVQQIWLNKHLAKKFPAVTA